MASGLILYLLLAASAPQNSAVPGTSSAEPFVERNQKQFTFYPGGKLQVEAGIPGNVRVIGWDRAVVVLDWERIIYRRTPEEARNLAARFPVQVRWTQTLGTIRTPGSPKDDADSDMEINLTLHVPKLRTDLVIRMLRGDLSIRDVNGWIEGTLTEGSVEAAGLAGYFSAVTRQGDLDIRMTGKRWTGHSCTAATQHGSVALVLPLDYGAALQLETRDGEISIDYPEQLVEGESVPLTAVAKKKAHSLSATVGDGGAPIRLKTSEGEVRLTASPQGGKEDSRESDPD